MKREDVRGLVDAQELTLSMVQEGPSAYCASRSGITSNSRMCAIACGR